MNSFAEVFRSAWLLRFGRKIGIASATEADHPLIEGLLQRMASENADFTRTFRGLGTGTARNEFTDRGAFDSWEPDWRARIAQEAAGVPAEVMAAVNPVRIPRNHRIEQAITAALDGDFAPFERLNGALAAPYAPDPANVDLEAAPWPGEIVSRTFCGT